MKDMAIESPEKEEGGRESQKNVAKRSSKMSYLDEIVHGV